MSAIILLIIAWSVAMVATVALVPVVIKWYRHHGWDRPHASYRQSVKDTHLGLVPRGGGIAIFAGVLAGALLIGHWDLQTAVILAAAAVLTLVGWWDDIRDSSPIGRLLVNIGVALAVALAGCRITFVTAPLGEGTLDLTVISWLPWVLTVVYIVALTNITNWAKGIDGQMPGTVAIAAVWIGVLSLRLSDAVNQTAILSFATAGAFFGFLFWNFYPQKIMPGYGGGSLAGFLLSVLSIVAGAKIATLFMVLALPIADAIFTILRRIIAGKSIFLGDRGHLHHKMLDYLHWGRRRIAIFYWSVTLIMGILAQILPTRGKIIAFLSVVAAVFIFLISVKLTSLRQEKMI